MSKQITKWILVCAPALIYFYFNYAAANTSLTFSMLLGMISLPFVIQPEEQKGGYRFLVIALLFGAPLLFFRAGSLFYFYSVFLFLFVIDNYWGKVNSLPIFLMIIISPVISKIVYLWSFPIRLQLSQLAGKALSIIGLDIKVDGNLIFLDGQSFAVDPACIGLKMIITALVLTIIMIAYFERKYHFSISKNKVTIILMITLLATIFSNFIRLLALILFYILPENPMHDVIGVLSLFLYVLLPSYFLLGYLFKSETPERVEIELIDEEKQTHHYRFITITYSLLLVFQIYLGVPFLSPPIEDSAAVAHIDLPLHEKVITKNGVLKFTGNKSLVYIKPPVLFFQGSHDPRYCWQGSGYKFSDVRLERIGTTQVYTARLHKNSHQLYTAWWYDNGNVVTPHEVTWRWESARGKPGFWMVNISVADRSELVAAIEQIQIDLKTMVK